MPEESIKLFISYSHLDEESRRELVAHLSGLINEGLITLWHDRKIEAGMEWANEIDANLNMADMVLLLVSKYFMDSRYCYGIELQKAMERHEAGEAFVVPIMLKAVEWTSAPFRKLQAFPKEAKPIYSSSWQYPDEAFVDVVQGIRLAAESLMEKRRQKNAQKEADRARYLQKVEEHLSDGVISDIERETLDELQQELGLTLEEIDEIERLAYEPHRKYEEDRNKYRKTLINQIEKGRYPFSDELIEELKGRQRDLGLKADDVARIEKPILAEAKAKYEEKLRAEAAERQRQLELEAETQRQLECQQQEQEAHASKCHRYAEEFAKAVRGIYPLSEPAQEGLRAFQQSLELTDEDIEPIKQPILAEAEAAYQQTLQAEAAERQRQLELEAEAERQVEQKQIHIEQYRQKVVEILAFGDNALAFEGISDAERYRLDELREDLDLTVAETETIERLIYKPYGDLRDLQAAAAEPQKQLQQQQQQQLAAAETQAPKQVGFKNYAELKGHSGMFAGVNTVAISPDGQTIASGSEDQTVKLWDFTTRKELATLSGHSNFVTAVAFSPDGNFLASASSDKTIKFWNLQTRQEVRTLIGHTKDVTSIAFNPNDDMLASGSKDKTIKLWNCKNGQEIWTLPAHSDNVMAVAFSPNGQILASGGWDNMVKLWCCNTRQQTFDVAAHELGTKSVAISPDGQTLVSSGRDGNCKLWNLATGELRQVISVQESSFLGAGVASVAISPSGEIIATACGEKKTVKLWSLETGNLIQTLSGYSKGVVSVVFSPDGQSLISGSHDKIVTIWS